MQVYTYYDHAAYACVYNWLSLIYLHNYAESDHVYKSFMHDVQLILYAYMHATYDISGYMAIYPQITIINN